MATRSSRLAEARHRRLLEAAVRRYAPRVWGPTRHALRAWLAKALAAARAPLAQLRLEARLHEFEKEWLAEYLREAGLEAGPEELLEGLGGTLDQFSRQVARDAGFLDHDPRQAEIRRHTLAMLEDDLSEYWRSITDPERLAARLVNLKAEGLSYVEMTRAVSRQYGTEFYRAERLVRSTYNTSANAAHLQDLRGLYDYKQWLTSRDSRVRTPTKSSPFDHRSADGQVVPIDQPFLVSGERLHYPGDRSLGASAGNVINCRCTVVGVENPTGRRVYRVLLH